MDKLLLRPCELHIEPEQPHAASVFNFWLRTVDDFISTLQELRRDDDPEVNKKRVVMNCLSPGVYPHVEEAETYDMIVQTLKALYVKKKNNVYARHLLASRRQGSDESISELLHVLKGLATDCSFSDVTAETYREELTRDAFINGLASAVRQRLLEKEELSLNQAFKLADNLGRVHRYSSCVGSLVPDQSLSMMTSDSTAKNSGAAGSTTRSSSTVVVSCFFCGLDTHQKRSLCPARNVSCHICGKRGHFAQVCRSKAEVPNLRCMYP